MALSAKRVTSSEPCLRDVLNAAQKSSPGGTRMGSLFLLEKRLPKEFGKDTQNSIVGNEKVVPAR